MLRLVRLFTLLAFLCVSTHDAVDHLLGGAAFAYLPHADLLHDHHHATPRHDAEHDHGADCDHEDEDAPVPERLPSQTKHFLTTHLGSYSVVVVKAAPAPPAVLTLFELPDNRTDRQAVSFEDKTPEFRVDPIPIYLRTRSLII